ncbi:MAG: SGNH/GDSL hydrolase family protein [Planctomycetota bacterium]|jgi:hypothetical protein
MGDSSGHDAHPSPHRRGDLLCLTLLLAGIAAMFQLERGSQRPLATPDLRAWRAESADGTALRLVPSGPAGLHLPTGSRFWLISEDHALNRYDEVSFGLRPRAEATSIDVLLRWTAGAGLRLRMQLGPDISASLWREGGSRDPQQLASSGPRAPDPPTGGAERQLAIRFEGNALSVSVDGLVILEHTAEDLGDGWIELRPMIGEVDVLALHVTGRKSTQSGELAPFEVSDRMRAVSAPPVRLIALGRGAGKLLALWLGGLLFLRALSGHRTSLASSAAAGMRLAAPTCALLLTGTLLHLPSTQALAAIVTPLGMIPAWRRLRPPSGTSADGTRRGRWAALATTGILCVGTAWMAGQREHALLEHVAAREAAARRGEPPAPFRSAAPLALAVDNALVVPGSWTDARLVATVALDPEAVLAVRLRAPDPSIAEGVLVVLPADPRLDVRVYREDPLHIWSLGDTAPPVTPDRDLQLEIEMRGRHLVASLDGQVVLAVESFEPTSGQIVLLSQRGRVVVRDVRVDALEAAELASSLATAARGALLPLAVLLGFATVASWLLPIGFLTALHAAAFALLPLLLLLLTLPSSAAPTAAELRAAALAGGGILAIVPLSRWRARPIIAVLLAAACGVTLTPTLRTALHPSTDVTADLMNRISYMDWPGEQLHEDLLHTEHPLFRRWNHYLARHRFRERMVNARKPPGTVRVVTLGGSSTWGWRVSPESRADYPAVLGGLLSRADHRAPGDGARRWEVINGAIVGATSGRQFRMLRNVLVDYDPDIVVLSVFYNDSPALSQGDEEAYLSRVTAPDYRRGWLDDWLEQRARGSESAALQAFMRGGLHRGGAGEAWRASGATGWPPDRFAASLRRYAEFARDHDIELVFVKEPIAGDKPFLWKEEFYAAMDAIGAEYGLTVVDPTPALQAAGGAKLFMDAVHLKPAGHWVVAEVLEPVVRSLARTEPR